MKLIFYYILILLITNNPKALYLWLYIMTIFSSISDYFLFCYNVFVEINTIFLFQKSWVRTIMFKLVLECWLKWLMSCLRPWTHPSLHWLGIIVTHLLDLYISRGCSRIWNSIWPLCSWQDSWRKNHQFKEKMIWGSS